MALTLTSADFAANGSIPSKHTCEGADSSPQLSWSGAPPQTKSFVLIVDDPDAPDPAAPKMTWVHWVLYNVPASTSAIERGATSLPTGAKQGVNDFKKVGFGGPCPPIGRHRYFFKLYALDALLPDLGPKARKDDVVKAMSGHVLAESQLMGTYEKAK